MMIGGAMWVDLKMNKCLELHLSVSENFSIYADYYHTCIEKKGQADWASWNIFIYPCLFIAQELFKKKC